MYLKNDEKLIKNNYYLKIETDLSFIILLLWELFLPLIYVTFRPRRIQHATEGHARRWLTWLTMVNHANHPSTYPIACNVCSFPVMSFCWIMNWLNTRQYKCQGAWILTDLDTLGNHYVINPLSVSVRSACSQAVTRQDVNGELWTELLSNSSRKLFVI